MRGVGVLSAVLRNGASQLWSCSRARKFILSKRMHQLNTTMMPRSYKRIFSERCRTWSIRSQRGSVCLYILVDANERAGRRPGRCNCDDGRVIGAHERDVKTRMANGSCCRSLPITILPLSHLFQHTQWWNITYPHRS